MIALLISIFISTSYSQGLSGDPVVIQAIKQNISICRNGNLRNCIKPMQNSASSIKAIEINVLSAEKVTITTYNENGQLADLEKDYSLKIVGDREKSLIDVDLEINNTASDQSLQYACKKNDILACNYYGQRLLDKSKIKEAIKLLKSKCDSNSIQPCITLFNHPKLDKDLSLKKYALTKLCNLKQYDFCNILGADLILTNKGHNLIIELVDSCKNGSSAGCLLSSQIFITENPREALKLLKMGCDQYENQDICYLLASIYSQIKKPNEANEFLKMSCLKGYSVACSNEFSNDIAKLFRDTLKRRGIMQDVLFKLNPNIKLETVN